MAKLSSLVPEKEITGFYGQFDVRMYVYLC